MGHEEQDDSKPTFGQQVFTAALTSKKFKGFWTKRISAVERANRQKRAQVRTPSWGSTSSTEFPADPTARGLVQPRRRPAPTQQFCMFISHLSGPLLFAYCNLILAVTKVTSKYFNFYADSCSLSCRHLSPWCFALFHLQTSVLSLCYKLSLNLYCCSV